MKGNIPWFVFNNRRKDDKKPVSLARQKRAFVMTVCMMTMLLGILALSASYCRLCFGVIVALLAVGGAAGFMRVVYIYCKGE